MSKCEQCGKEYESKRSSSAYCSSKCKQAFYRNRINKPVTVSVTPNVTVTDDDGYRSRGISGKCWCCGDSIHPGLVCSGLVCSGLVCWGLVCCGPCAWSGKAKEERAGRYPPLLTDRTPEQMERDLHSKEMTGPIPVVVGKPGDEDYNGIIEIGDEHDGAVRHLPLGYVPKGEG